MDKESILDYLDKGRKGYISLCDFGRVFRDIIVWTIVLIIFSIPGISITKQNQIYSIYCVFNIIIGWVAIATYIVTTFLLLGIIEELYNKFKRKTKLCKIKLIKLK